MSRPTEPQRLEDFAAPYSESGPFKDAYFWVVERRLVDDAGTPLTGKWEYLFDVPCNNPRVRWPHKLDSIAPSLERYTGILGLDHDPVEVRIRLTKEVHETLSLAITPSWVIGKPRKRHAKKRVERKERYGHE